MTIKERQLVLHFLQMLEQELNKRKVTEIDPVLLKYLDRKTLVEMIQDIFENMYVPEALMKISDENLLAMIGDDGLVLSYLIKQWKQRLKITPIATQERVNDFFDQIQLGPHYLRDKPVEIWDDYDRSNYYSILFKRGKTQKVYAIFTSDVEEGEQYAVTTQPDFYFDSEEEAEQDLQRLIKEGRNPEDLKIMSLWKII